jgi:hypothetical protein
MLEVVSRISGMLIGRLADGQSLRATLRSHLLKGIEKVGLGLERHVKTQELAGQSLDARTGTLRRSIFHRSYEEGQTHVVTVVGADTSMAKYARVQELGGTITPKRSRFLTIPIGEARTAKGVTRFTARQVIENPGSFGYAGTFVRNQVIFGKRSDGSADPLFALRPSVTLKAVGYLAGTAEERREWAKGTLAQSVADATRELANG